METPLGGGGFSGGGGQAGSWSGFSSDGEGHGKLLPIYLGNTGVAAGSLRLAPSFPSTSATAEGTPRPDAGARRGGHKAEKMVGSEGLELGRQLVPSLRVSGRAPWSALDCR